MSRFEVIFNSSCVDGSMCSSHADDDNVCWWCDELDIFLLPTLSNNPGLGKQVLSCPLKHII